MQLSSVLQGPHSATAPPQLFVVGPHSTPCRVQAAASDSGMQPATHCFLFLTVLQVWPGGQPQVLPHTSAAGQQDELMQVKFLQHFCLLLQTPVVTQGVPAAALTCVVPLRLQVLMTIRLLLS